MPRHSRYSRYDTSDDEDDELAWSVFRSMEAGKSMQTRFQRIPDSHLNAETVAGIRDMNLGRVRADGTRTGRPTIRFDTGQNTSPHINIDPRGYPNRNNPHIQVPEGVIRSAKVINKTLKYAGIGLTVVSVAVDLWRFGSAFKDDKYVLDHADEMIEELESSIKKLKKLRKTENSSKRIREIDETIEKLQEMLDNVKRTKKVPVKTIKTASSIAGGWAAGAAGGYGGALAGAQVGAAVGTCFGPVGTVVGAPVGAVIGALGLGIGAGMAGSAAGEYVADEGIKTFVDP